MDPAKLTVEEIGNYYKVKMTIDYIFELFKMNKPYKNFNLSDQVTSQIYMIGSTQVNLNGYDRYRWSEFIYLINKKEDTLPVDFNTKFQEMLLNNS